MTFLGGDGHDKLVGSTADDVLHGGAGNDDLDGYNGNDQVYGDDGDDRLSGGQLFSSDLLDGGAGHDTIDADWYDNNNPTNSVTVTLDGVADDGRPGEGDNVVRVETIKTRQAARLVAGADPVIFDVTGTASGSTTLIGSPGPDRLRSFDYDDTIQGGAGNDAIEGGNGHDTIDPGPGQDSVIADAGPNSCDFFVQGDHDLRVARAAVDRRAPRPRPPDRAARATGRPAIRSHRGTELPGDRRSDPTVGPDRRSGISR